MDLRNLALIAHVDHGKTTLVDAMLRESGSLPRGASQDRLLDRETLERERGLTILAKNAALVWKGTRVNIVDTPGHADFGGEVERALAMVDGALLLVDAVEGPMPQTRFVLRKALSAGLRPLVVVNKVDRSEARPDRVLAEVFDLMIDLGASEDQLDFPYLYAVAREGRAWREGEVSRDLAPLLDAILDHIPPPSVEAGPFRMRVASLDHSPYLGRIAIGRVHAGRVRKGDRLVHLSGRASEAGRAEALFVFDGLGRREVEETLPGDIVALAGVEGVEIGDTLAAEGVFEPLPRLAVDPPTVALRLFPDAGPFAAREATRVTARQIGDRLDRELATNVALRVERLGREAFLLKGRGEMHLAVLLESMRREGYAFVVGPPEVLVREGEEPYERLQLDLPRGRFGAVMAHLGERGGELVDLGQEGERVRAVFRLPARALFGFKGRYLALTGGEGLYAQSADGYGPPADGLVRRATGSAYATEGGRAYAYALGKLEARVRFFIAPGEAVYPGMIVGEHVRPGNLGVNVTRNKKLTNVRAAGSDEQVRLAPPRRLSLEEALGYLVEGEVLEVTPRALRLRLEKLPVKPVKGR